MTYIESLIPSTVRHLTGAIKVAMLCLPQRKFLTTILQDKSSYDFDGTFYCLQQGVENLRKTFGDDKANQLLEMVALSKLHHETGWALNGKIFQPKGPGWQEVCLGNYLLQDAEMVAMDRQPWAYPQELYRWPTDPSHPEISEADLMNKDEEAS